MYIDVTKAKFQELIDAVKAKNEESENKLVWGLALIGGIVIVAIIAYAVYRFLTPDYYDDYDDDDFDDDFDDFDDDDDFDEVDEEPEAEEEEPAAGEEDIFAALGNVREGGIVGMESHLAEPVVVQRARILRVVRPELAREAEERAHVHAHGADGLTLPAVAAGVGLPRHGVGRDGRISLGVGIDLDGELAGLFAVPGQHLAPVDAGPAVALEAASGLGHGRFLADDFDARGLFRASVVDGSSAVARERV